MKLSNEYTWNHSEYEVFNFLKFGWDVRKAKEIIVTKKPRKVETMDISGLVSLVGAPGKITMGIGVDWDVVQNGNIDLDFPCIIIPFKGNHLPIDGWHRIAKAKLLNVAALTCVCMNKSETKLIEL